MKMILIDCGSKVRIFSKTKENNSALDLDAFKTVANMLKSMSSENNSFIIITHYFKILEFIEVDKVYIMKEGKIIREGGRELVDEIMVKGFE